MYIFSKQQNKYSYIPALERWSLYKSIWQNHWIDFQEIYNTNFLDIYGKISQRKIEEVQKLIDCGNFLNGFQKYTCKECGISLVVPFTCKSRLCLSCNRKKLFSWSSNLSYILNTDFHHIHVTFTIPGNLANILLQKGYSVEKMISLAAKVYKIEFLKAAKIPEDSIKDWHLGILATVHKCGNSLNYNPHVHLVGTKELINIKTGEILENTFISYKSFRVTWMKTFCKHLLKQKILTEKEFIQILEKYKNGFHVYFQPIHGDHNEVLFRIAEYIASGFFHNSQILKVDHQNKKVVFRYKSWVDRNTGEKSFKVITMDLYEFMAKMLFFLPEPNTKMIRYYGIYAQSLGQRLRIIEQVAWVKAIEHCFNTNPIHCPDCRKEMELKVVYSYFSYNEISKLKASHDLINGYFRPRSRSP
ncbi:MAG: transposase [Leptospiraceae bacterium]|nr:transposase [Leptospiraceae bacterium]